MASRSALCVKNGWLMSILLNTSTFWRATNLTGHRKWASYILRCGSGRGSSARLGLTGRTVASPSDRNDPGEAEVDQRGELRLIGNQPKEPNRTFVAAFGKTYFFRAGELFVARHALESVSERPRVERRDRNRIETVHTFFGRQLESDGRIAADLRYPTVKSKQILGSDQEFFLVEQFHWQASNDARPPPAKGLILRAFEAACWNLGSDSS